MNRIILARSTYEYLKCSGHDVIRQLGLLAFVRKYIMKTLLHLSHTDILTDSRILKEMGALAQENYSVFGIGVLLEEGAAPTKPAFSVKVESVRLRSRRFTFLPRIIRHALSMLELILKMLPRGVQLNPNVVHCHDTLVLPIGVLVCWFTRAKLVYDAHELESNRNGITKIQGQITLWVEKFLWNFIDALIVVSPSIQKWYFENLGYKRSAVILNSPLFDDKCDGRNDYLRRFFNIPSGELIFIYVGILGYGRGLKIIEQAFMNCDIKSHVVFLGFGEMSDYLKDLEKKHRNFHLHAAVPHSQVVPIVKSADVGLCLVENVSLSDYCCLPNKLFEYCFAGIPVLASDFPDIKLLVNKYQIGECCDLQVESIIDAIKRFESKTSKMTFADLNPLSWQEQENKLLALYRFL